ncbi:hypothetical protein M8C21_031133, partial [Ambrosia artemisiifolia]
ILSARRRRCRWGSPLSLRRGRGCLGDKMVRGRGAHSEGEGEDEGGVRVKVGLEVMMMMRRRGCLIMHMNNNMVVADIPVPPQPDVPPQPPLDSPQQHWVRWAVVIGPHIPEPCSSYACEEDHASGFPFIPRQHVVTIQIKATAFPLFFSQFIPFFSNTVANSPCSRHGIQLTIISFLGGGQVIARTMMVEALIDKGYNSTAAIIILAARDVNFDDT